MRTTISCTWAAAACTVIAVMAATGAAAQTAPRSAAERRREDQQLKESRYQIGQMERVLEGAVEHGATLVRDRLQASIPADMLLTENARARGFRLEGYGVFFDVQVPSLEGTLPWVFRTLDQNDLALDGALRTVRAFLQGGAAANDANLQQAFKRIELQVAPLAPAGASNTSVLASDPAAGVQATAVADQAPAPAIDPILNNPNEAYRAAIRGALVDAMLEHTRGLGLAPNELLTVAARRTEDRPRLASADQEAQTVLLSVRGSDLTAFLAGDISRDEAVARVTVRVF